VGHYWIWMWLCSANRVGRVQRTLIHFSDPVWQILRADAPCWDPSDVQKQFVLSIVILLSLTGVDLMGVAMILNCQALGSF
jgi:hypothetical protein